MIHTQENDQIKKNELSRVESVYRAIKKSILFNEFPPGYQALEPELAKRLDVSRTPVREALIRLEAEKLIVLVPRRGMRVTPLVKSDIDEMLDIIEALERLVIHLLGLSNDLDKAVLQAQWVVMQEAVDSNNVDAWIIAEDRFNLLCASATGNTRLVQMIRNLRDQLTRAQKGRIEKQIIPLNELMHLNTMFVETASSSNWAEFRNLKNSYYQRFRADITCLLGSLNAV